MISAKRSAYLTANRSEFLSADHSLLPAAHLAVADAGSLGPWSITSMKAGRGRNGESRVCPTSCRAVTKKIQESTVSFLLTDSASASPCWRPAPEPYQTSRLHQP